MLVLMFGSYGTFTDLCRDMVVKIAQSFDISLQPTEISPFHPPRESSHPSIDCLGSLAKAVLEAPDQDLLCISRTPDRAFFHYAALAQSSSLVCVDDPRLAALEKSENLGIPLVDAVRMSATSCSCLVPVLAAEKSRVITHENFLDAAERVAGIILTALKRECSKSNVKVVEDVISSYHPAIKALFDPNRISDLRLRHSEKDLIALEGALSSYNNDLFGQEIRKIVVTRSLFFANSEGNLVSDPPAIIDVTGRARLLVSGPYIPVPAGKWMFRLVLATSAELVGAPFHLEGFRHERGTVTHIAQTSFSPISGKSVVEMHFFQLDPNTILEFRLSVDRATFEGRVSVGYGEFIRIEDAHLSGEENLIEWVPE